MSDPRDDEHADIRALLGELGREPAPLPDQVATRLDAVLEGLVDERGARRVVPLRRRRAPRLLAAATVVAVVGGVGVGLAQMAGHQGGGAASSTAGASAQSGPALTALPELSTRHFGRDAARVVATDQPHAAGRRPSAQRSAAATDSSPGQSTGQSTGPSTGATPASPDNVAGVLPACATPTTAPGARLLAARVDGRPATLVLRPLPGGRTRVTAYSCPARRVLAAATVPR
jgi:hypothetical protein